MTKKITRRKKKMKKNRFVYVVYAGAGHIPREDVPAYLEKISEMFSGKSNNNELWVVVPCFDTDNIRVECINPVLLTPEKYAEAEATVDRFNEAVDQLLNMRNLGNEDNA